MSPEKKNTKKKVVGNRKIFTEQFEGLCIVGHKELRRQTFSLKETERKNTDINYKKE